MSGYKGRAPTQGEGMDQRMASTLYRLGSVLKAEGVGEGTLAALDPHRPDKLIRRDAVKVVNERIVGYPTHVQHRLGALRRNLLAFPYPTDHP